MEAKIDWKKSLHLKGILFKILAAISATVAFKGFMVPNHFLDGGINGISILIHELTHINMSILIIVFNIPFIVIGYIKIGKQFALNSITSILILSIMLYFLEVPTITTDTLLIAVFGGILMGVAIGLVIKSGGVLDGMEVLSEYTTQKSVFNNSEIIMTINVFIFLCAGYKFGIEKAMYSIITFYSALKTSNYIVDGFEAYHNLTVVSSKSEIIKETMVKKYKKAITVYKGERGYLPSSFEIKNDCDIIVLIITRLEIHHIKKEIKKIDPQAFIYLSSINEVDGGVIKKLRAH